MAVLLQTKTKQNTMNNMKNTNPIFSLKNFRSFGEEGADLELAPITVLTGCNSAGKSSLVKAQLLLKDFLQRFKGKGVFTDFDLQKADIHISDKDLALGNYGKLLNKKSEDGKIELSYTTHSNYLAEDVRVVFVFVNNKESVLGDGLLYAFRIEKFDGSIIYNNSDLIEEGSISQRSYLSIMDNFRRFLMFCLFINADMCYQVDRIRKEDYEYIKGLVKQQKISKNTASQYYRLKRFEKLPNYNFVEQWINNNSFFYYLPIFKELEGKDIKAVRKYLMHKYKVNEGKWQNPNKILDWIQLFCDEIETSSYSSFKEYFAAKELEYFENADDYIVCCLTRIDDMYTSTGNFLDEEYVEKKLSNNSEENRLSKEDYKKYWNLYTVVKSLELLCYDGINYNEYSSYDVYNTSSSEYEECKCLLDCLITFYGYVVSECLAPVFFEDVKYINSSSVAINRMYSVDNTDKIGTCLNQFLKGNHQRFKEAFSKGFNMYISGSFMNKWIKKLDIGDAIRIEGTDQGLGILAFLEKDGEKRLLADEGYGITQFVALLMQIENNILNATRGENHKYMPSTICVEEPEIHLHPKYQSLLADMFVEAYREYNIHFIIETHSEYLIRKLQVMVADKDNSLSSNDVSINYVEKDEEGVSHNKKINIKDDGSLDGSFGSGFYDEASRLAIQLFKAKSVLS